MHTAEERANYETYLATQDQTTPTTYSIPLSQRLWIERVWQELGYRSRSQLVQDAIARLMQANQTTE